MAFLFAFILCMLFAAAIAHLAGWYLADLLDVEPGHIREVMPTIPVAPLHEGSAERRWKKKVRDTEKVLVDRFEGGVSGVTAAGLAGELNRDERVVAGALERMREEVDCRMRITRSGRILHDFSADAIQKLRRERARSLPAKLLTVGIAAAANIGAIWPIMAILFMAVASLHLMAQYARGVQWGLFGLGSIAALLVGTLLLSLKWHLYLTPFIDGPNLGPMAQSEQTPNRYTSSRSSRRSGHFLAFFDIDIEGGGMVGGGHGDLDLDFDFDGDGGGVLGVIVAILLIAIVVLALITVFVWLRGLWRAVTRRNERLDRLSPSFWVRAADRVDNFEKWMPTNDLVGRIYRAVKRAFTHRRPVDADLGPRTLARAKRRGGIVSALEIAMEEGLDVSEATEVGAELCNIVGGEVVVGEEGEVGFSFPDEVLREIDETAGLRDPKVHNPMTGDDDERYPDPERMDHLWAEYVDLFDPGFDGVSRRPAQPNDALPVNLVGVGWGHLLAANRLVAGTWLMAGMGMYLAIWGAPRSIVPYLFGADPSTVGLFGAIPALTAAILVLMAIGTSCLAAAGRYVATRYAVHGVRRDARRAAFDSIHGALLEGETSVDLSGLADAVVDAFRPVWPDIPRKLVEREIKGALADLEVGFDLEAPPDKATDMRDLGALLERWERAVHGDTFETVLGRTVERRDEVEEDEVVFDTKREHDHATALA